MELQNSISIYLTSFLFLFMMLLTLIKRSNSHDTTCNLPPGPWKLPFIGNIHQLFGSLPHHCLRNLAAKHGPLMHLQLGGVSNIIVSSPEIAKQVMKAHDINFSDRPNYLFSRTISYNNRNIVFSPYGNYWRELRKICTIELLTTKRVQSFASIREEEVSLLIKTIAGCEGSIVNLSEKIHSLTYGITARAAFGKKNRQQQKFISAVEEILHLGGGFCVADLYPSSKVAQMISIRTKNKLERLHKETDEILQDIIHDHRNRKGGQCEEEEDLVDVLLKLQQQLQDSQKHPLTDENIKAVIQDIFAGGGDTSSGVVLWGMSEMIKNPKVMEQAQAEVRRLFDMKGYVDETELHQLTYLKCVIKETLRLHPPLPLLVPRENRETCKIKEYEIPANSMVTINAWDIGRDPENWSEAESFKPERFLNSSIDFRGTDFEYIPFGAGRRMCPGITFGIPNVELPLAKLIYHFDWKLINEMKNEDIDMTESFGIVVHRKNDLCLIPTIRRT